MKTGLVDLDGRTIYIMESGEHLWWLLDLLRGSKLAVIKDLNSLNSKKLVSELKEYLFVENDCKELYEILSITSPSNLKMQKHLDNVVLEYITALYGSLESSVELEEVFHPFERGYSVVFKMPWIKLNGVEELFDVYKELITNESNSDFIKKWCKGQIELVNRIDKTNFPSVIEESELIDRFSKELNIERSEIELHYVKCNDLILAKIEAIVSGSEWRKVTLLELAMFERFENAKSINPVLEFHGALRDPNVSNFLVKSFVEFLQGQFPKKHFNGNYFLRKLNVSKDLNIKPKIKKK